MLQRIKKLVLLHRVSRLLGQKVLLCSSQSAKRAMWLARAGGEDGNRDRFRATADWFGPILVFQVIPRASNYSPPRFVDVEPRMLPGIVEEVLFPGPREKTIRRESFYSREAGFRLL